MYICIHVYVQTRITSIVSAHPFYIIAYIGVQGCGVSECGGFKLLISGYPLTHIGRRCEVPTPSALRVDELRMSFKAHILKHHIPELTIHAMIEH